MVNDADGAPVSGAAIEIAGLGDEARTATNAAGVYSFKVLAATGGSHNYPSLQARKAAYLADVKPSVTVADGGATVVNFVLERDWSSPAGGAGIERSTGPDNTSQGCGPGGLIDDDPATVWGSSNIAPEIVVDLGAPVQVSRIAIDPAAGCGDDASAALGGYRLRGATGPKGPFTAIDVQDSFVAADNGRLNNAFTGARTPRPLRRAAGALAAGRSDGPYVDVAELHVARTPGSAIGPSADTGGVQGVGSSAATLTAPSRRKRRDVGRVRVRHDDRVRRHGLGRGAPGR